MPTPAEILSPKSKGGFLKDSPTESLNLSLGELFHVGLTKGHEMGKKPKNLGKRKDEMCAV